MDPERLERENDLLRGVYGRLVGASSRASVEQGTCEAVAAVDGIWFAWLGTRRMSGDTVVPRASAGAGDGYLDEMSVTTDESPTGVGPAGRALADREPAVQSVHDLEFRAWRDAALDRGFEEVAGIPLVSNGALHGVLVVYAGTPDVLDEAFVDVLADVGNLVATALAAVERHRRLRAGRLVELDVRVTASGAFPYDVTRALDCMAELNGFTAEREGFLVYFDVTGPDAKPDAVRDVTDSGSVRVLDPGGSGCTVEVLRPPESVLGALADVGVTLADATVTDGTANITAHLAPDAAIPAVVDRLDAVADDVTVASKREVQRDLGSTNAAAFDALTDRQHTVLTAAYHAGYFDWPRASSGEDLADALDISPPTFYQHLRAAERNLLDALIDGE